MSYTSIPNKLLDELMPEMNDPALRVTLALLRYGGKATSAQLRDHTGLSKPSISSAVIELRTLGVIYNTKESMEALAAAELLRKKQGQSNCPGDFPCEWCKGKTMVLHKHHFPIPARDGGIDTVSICPNCHAEYHALVDAATYQLRWVDEWGG